MRARRVWAVLLIPVLAGCSVPSTEGGSVPALSESLPCADAVRTSPLPEWAREGFNPSGAGFVHVVGVRGDIVGVVFGHPLHAPRPEPGRNNKILWVGNPAAAVSPGDGPAVSPAVSPDAGFGLRIHATLNGTGLTADRELDVGPSLVDMPRAGCWTFTLTWAGHQDQVAVRYLPS